MKASTAAVLWAEKRVVMKIHENKEIPKIVPVVYPDTAVKTIAGLGFTENEYVNVKRGDFSYEGNSGHPEATVVVSPHFSLDIEGVQVPVYATVVYIGENSDCALHSYAIAETDSFDDGLNVKISLLASNHDSVVVLPKEPQVSADMKNGFVTAEITAPGDYTFVFCDHKGVVDQYHSVTLFIRGYREEDEEIKYLKDKLGSENVMVFDAGVRFFNHIEIEKDDSVLYFRRGSLLIARGNPEYSDNDSYIEEGAQEKTGWGFTRYPLISANGKRNIRIAGNGTIDAGQLGWHERRGVVLHDCSRFKISGLTILNVPEWAMILYCCDDFHISDVRVFGYKTNSDGIAVCNSSNAEVSGCFSRSGDDLFEVKTFKGGPKCLAAENIIFRNCIAWAGKARCFGVIAELHRNVNNVIFKDCSVIVRDATWDDHILGSLVIICSEGSGKISGITFENIDIWQDHGRAINIVNTDEKQDERIVEKIVFRNIKYKSVLPDIFIAGERGRNRIEAEFIGLIRNGSAVTRENIGEHVIMDTHSKLTVSL